MFLIRVENFWCLFILWRYVNHLLNLIIGCSRKVRLLRGLFANKIRVIFILISRLSWSWSCAFGLSIVYVIDSFILGLTIILLFLSRLGYKLRLILWCHNERLQIRNRQSTASICTQRCIWFVDSLLEPTNKLSPNIASIILFWTLVDRHSLIFWIQWLILFVVIFDITFTYAYFITTTLVILLWCKVRYCFRV